MGLHVMWLEHPGLSRDRALVASDQAPVLIVEADRAAWQASAGGGYSFPYLHALSYLNAQLGLLQTKLQGLSRNKFTAGV